MPLFGHSKHDDEHAGPLEPASPDFDGLLARFNGMPMAQRAAEMLAGISSELPHGERSAMDNLLARWLGDQYTADDRPDSWYTLKYVLAEAFQALVLSRLVFRIEESPNGPTICYYAISSDGMAALGRADVADVVARRLPD